MSERCSRWTMPVLRIGMGVFLALWGVDKIVATEAAAGIFDRFYGLPAGPTVVQAAGAAEVLLGLLLAVGLFRVPVAWIALIVNAVSTFSSWRQILDPWGILGLTDGGTHLFLASIVIMAANIVIVLNARDPWWTLDARLRGAAANSSTERSGGRATG